MEITAKMVKELRECTGAGMMDCKKALAEVEGDVEKAVDLLRTKGLAALEKKSGRATNEGTIAGFVNQDNSAGALIEVACETDFVAINADFKAFAGDLARQVVEGDPADVTALMGQEYLDRDHTVEQVLGETVSKLDENMNIARFVRYTLDSDAGVVTYYVHGVGKIAVLVELSASAADAAAAPAAVQAAKDIAMQVAASTPVAIDRDSFDQSVIDHEMEIYKAQAAESGKPEEIQEKIAQGRLQKYFKESALVEQPFVKDPDASVGAYLASVSKEVGGDLTVARFERMVLGEGATAEGE
jgi:elongation factor Ts